MIKFAVILALFYVLYLMLRGLPKRRSRETLAKNMAQEMAECHACGVHFDPAEMVQKEGKRYCRKCLESL